MFQTVLIANRGEIARRINRTLQKMGIQTVAVYSDADRFAPHVLEADTAVHLGPAPVTESYLNVDVVIAACQQTGAQAVHPGYGFLSENTTFAARLADTGITFIGPRPEHLTQFGLKHEARAAAAAAGVPLLPGTDLLHSLEDAQKAASEIGYPVMLKSTAGGGGIGLRLCHTPEDLIAEYDVVKRLGAGNFGDDGVFIEKFVATARHIEVQIFGDGAGRVVAIGERDCSLQRRNQKVVEEAPAPNLDDTVRAAMHAAAVALGEAVHYESAGTIEFIYDTDTAAFYFLEVNTRLQVEHGVTETIYGIDLVEWMVRQAAGETLALNVPTPNGAAMEVRINAEDPARDFRPSIGRLTNVSFPADIRVDGWISTGTEITAYYDNLLAKPIVWGPDRAACIAAMQDALTNTALDGLETNKTYLHRIIETDWFAAGDVSTRKLASFTPPTRLIEVLSGGAQTTVQDWPGRLGYWDVGVPPNGPMDDLTFRLLNRVIGNPEGTAALECAFNGPSLKFLGDATIAIGGANMQVLLDETPVQMWQPIPVTAGQTLTLSKIDGPGNRTYIAFAGGLDVPEFLGSAATFTLGQFGGHSTGALRPGDVLRLKDAATEDVTQLSPDLIPIMSKHWDIGVLYGPHGAPDYFTPEDINTLFSTNYEVHFNSARTGVRLIGPKPKWARTDGGEAGLHPSNIHDNAYAVGALDFTGDMPVILGPDGPSLGGFVCPVTICLAELWKVGQLHPGDTIRFHPWTTEQAETARQAQNESIASLELSFTTQSIGADDRWDNILRRSQSHDTALVYRRSGDDNVLVEFGPPKLDLNLRFQAHSLMTWLQQEKIKGIVDLTPGIRSLQVHFDRNTLSQDKMMDILAQAETELPRVDEITVPSRTVYLPLSWDDPSTQEAIDKYMSGVNPDAPWCPSNIEFIRHINGLADEQAVKDVVFNADYMVMGLGDVYLGAPVATPVDPRQRLVTTKYNPARTWTPENAVGIGGAYMCIYGMEGPGGYQFVGRTIQVWNTWRTTDVFHQDTPWLLRFFDRIKFFPVDQKELADARAAFPHGQYPIRIEDGTFSLADHEAFCAQNTDSINAFKSQRQAAFDAERARWEAMGLNTFDAMDPGSGVEDSDLVLPEGGFAAEASMQGSVWKLLVGLGDRVGKGQPVAVLEAMKMEFEVTAPQDGRVLDLLVQTGTEVRAGQPLMTFISES